LDGAVLLDLSVNSPSVMSMFGIDALKSGKSQRGRPFKQNTLADYVVFLKRYLGNREWIQYASGEKKSGP